MLYLFNTTICPTAGLTYHTRFVSEAAARVIFERAFPTSDRARLEAEGGAGWLSAIGHDATAQVATSILGHHIPVSRIAAVMAAGDEVKAQLEAGISYQGSDPAGMLRVSMLTMLRRIVHEHLDSAVADIRSNGKVTGDDLCRMRASLTARLLDQIGELGEEVDCGRGEQD